MPANTVLTAEGQRELYKVFQLLKDSAGTRTLKAAVQGGSKPVVKDLRGKLRQHKRSGTLAKSVGANTKVYKRSHTVIASVGVRGSYRGEYEGKRVLPYKYFHFIEEGFTDRSGTFHPGKHYLRNALESNKAQAERAIVSKLKDQVLKAASRARNLRRLNKQ